MSKCPRGKIIPLSIGRRLVDELLHHAAKVPSLPLSRECRIEVLVDARSRLPKPPSWVALFMKAYAIVAQRYPELRRAYLPYPYPRLYEHPRSECAILTEREWEGESVVLAAKIQGPESTSLTMLDGHMRRCREDDLWTISPFRQLLRLGTMPKIVRRFIFWSTLNFSGYKRAKRFGTFMMSSLGNLGAEQIHPLTPLTSYLTFGPIRPDGTVTVKVIYDHRVMDGRTVARALLDLETTLNTTMVAELREMPALTRSWRRSPDAETAFAGSQLLAR